MLSAHPVARRSHQRKAPVATLLGRWGIALALCSGFACTHGATFEGQLAVHMVVSDVNTTQPSAPGVCISQTLSRQTNALVRVVCGKGQFVSISANPGSRLLGTHGGAFRYLLNSNISSSGIESGLQERWENFYPGTGTVTAMRFYNASGFGGLIEILLTF